MTENKTLQNRMKEYEDASKVQFPSDSIIVARLDGRGFSKFTKNFKKPFDEKFTKAMVEVTKTLVKETGATIGYTQSDEISLIWHTDNPNGQVFFNGKLMKICSVCASIATAEFNDWMRFLQVKTNNNGQFDCRASTVPNKAEAVNYLLYRQKDCIKNSISMATSTVYSHKEQMNVNTTEKLDMLKDKGIDWNDYMSANRTGTFVQRRTFEGFAEDPRNPGMVVPCTRSRVEALGIEDLSFDELNKVVFGGEEDA